MQRERGVSGTTGGKISAIEACNVPSERRLGKVSEKFSRFPCETVTSHSGPGDRRSARLRCRNFHGKLASSNVRTRFISRDSLPASSVDFRALHGRSVTEFNPQSADIIRLSPAGALDSVLHHFVISCRSSIPDFQVR